MALQGYVAPGFESVATVFLNNLQNGIDIGGSVCAFYKGKEVLDIIGGKAQVNKKEDTVDRSRPWKRDTVVNVYSCSKSITSFCFMVLVDRNIISFNDKVCKFWPSFAQNGKENITIADLLSHQGALASLDGNKVTNEELIDWYMHIKSQCNTSLDNINNNECHFTKRLASQQPNWNLKSGLVGYHAITLGFYTTELIRRIDQPKHRTIRAFFNDEIRSKVKLSNLPNNINQRLQTSSNNNKNNDNNDNNCNCHQQNNNLEVKEDKALFYFGYDDEAEEKSVDLARIYRTPSSSFSSYSPTPLPPFPPTSTKASEAIKQLQDERIKIARRAYSLITKFSPWKCRNLEISSAIGFTNAKSLASIYNAIVNTNLIIKNKYTIIQSFQLAVAGEDITTFSYSAFSNCGLQVDWTGKYPQSRYHGGVGGSFGFCDSTCDRAIVYKSTDTNDTVSELDEQIVFSFVPNALEPDNIKVRKDLLLNAFYKSIAQLKSSNIKPKL